MVSIKEFQVFVKPIGASCNLACSYCYYSESQKFYKELPITRMSENILEKYICQHFEAATEDYIIFSWHGGEPTLAGIEFYKRVLDFQDKYNLKGIKVLNGIQTNGTNLNDQWCSFLSKENFFVGVSIDGPENHHNKFRISKSGKGSFKSVINGVELLHKHEIAFEILCVVNAHNVMKASEIYDFFKSLNARFISFLPLVEQKASISTEASQDSVPAEAFGDFLIQIFDEWLENDVGKVKIQIFEEALRSAFKQDHTLCIFKKTCGGVPVLELNGDLYSCDHFVKNEHLLGNITNFSIAELLNRSEQIQFGQVKYSSLPNYCLNCDVLEMCNGECPKNRFIKSPLGEPGLNYLCPGYRKFFRHCIPFINAIASIWNGKSDSD
jgi:uncharacterized protein